MNRQIEGAAIPALGWTVGVVALVQGCVFGFGSSTGRAFTHSDLPMWVRPVLGGTEALAALLFLVPVTRVAGGYALLMIFFVAAAIHLLHRWYDIGGLAVYAMAVLVCLAQHSRVQLEDGR